MRLPSPDDYEDTREFLRVLVAALEDGSTEVGSAGSAGSATVIPTPSGFTPVWYGADDARLYLGNVDFSPPTAESLFQIDTLNIALAAIETGNVAPQAIVSALIGDAQIVQAKIADLAVNEAKIANAAVTSAKIANLAVGTANIQLGAITTALIGDAQITNAKIGNQISSDDWNNVTKTGWSISKNGNIEGRGLALYDNTGTLIFSAGGTIPSSRVTGLGALAALNSLGYGSAYLTGFGTFAGISLLNSGNISTYIAGAAIGNALIGNAAINTANINGAQITSALIVDGTIVNGDILNATILTGKIASATIIQANMASASVGSAQIINGSILSAAIGNAQILSAHIGLAQITTALIANLAVENAHIQNLTIGTGKVLDEAFGRAGTYSSSTPVLLNAGTWQDIGSPAASVSVVLESSGVAGAQKVIIDLTMILVRFGSSNDFATFRITRHNGTQVDIDWPVEITDDASSQHFQFTDYTPITGGTATYYANAYNTTGTPYVNRIHLTAKAYLK